VTIASAPFVGRDGDGYRVIWVFPKSRIFFQKGLDGLLAKHPSGKSVGPSGARRKLCA
jgi:hypothetical protein